MDATFSVTVEPRRGGRPGACCRDSGWGTIHFLCVHMSSDELCGAVVGSDPHSSAARRGIKFARRFLSSREKEYLIPTSSIIGLF